jgi:hypothetical protein
MIGCALMTSSMHTYRIQDAATAERGEEPDVDHVGDDYHPSLARRRDKSLREVASVPKADTSCRYALSKYGGNPPCSATCNPPTFAPLPASVTTDCEIGALIVYTHACCTRREMARARAKVLTDVTRKTMTAIPDTSFIRQDVSFFAACVVGLQSFKALQSSRISLSHNGDR